MNSTPADRMNLLLTETVKELVDLPESVQTHHTLSEGGNTLILTVRTAQGEMGKVIGKSGKNAQALRTLFEAIAAKYRLRVVLEIADSRRRRNHGQQEQN